MDHEPKISLVEALLLVMYVGFTDLIGLVLVFFALDDFFILDVLTFPVTQIYFRMKGVNKAGYDVAANLLEIVPYLGALPIRTVGILAVIWADRHPEGLVSGAAQIAGRATAGRATTVASKTMTK